MCIGILQQNSLTANCILFESVTPSIFNNLNYINYEFQTRTERFICRIGISYRHGITTYSHTFKIRLIMELLTFVIIAFGAKYLAKKFVSSQFKNV